MRSFLILVFFVVFCSFSKEQKFNCDSNGNSGSICSKTIKLNNKIYGYETYFYVGDLITDIVRYDVNRSFNGKVFYHYNADGLLVKESHLNSKREVIINDVYSYNSVFLLEKEKVNNELTKYFYNEENQLILRHNYLGAKLQNIDSLTYYTNDSVSQVYSYNSNHELINLFENTYFSNGVKKITYYDGDFKIIKKELFNYDGNRMLLFQQFDALDNKLAQKNYYYENGKLSKTVYQDFVTSLTREEFFKIIE